MRDCKFCGRFFKNKQAVRRHLGYCEPYLHAEDRAPPWKRVALHACVACVDALGREHAAGVTSEEMHEQFATHGGCATCGGNVWIPVGWRRVPT